MIADISRIASLVVEKYNSRYFFVSKVIRDGSRYESFSFVVRPWLLTLTPKYKYSFSPHFSLYITHGTDKENLFYNQVLKLWIIFFFLMTLLCFRDDNGKRN